MLVVAGDWLQISVLSICREVWVALQLLFPFESCIFHPHLHPPDDIGMPTQCKQALECFGTVGFGNQIPVSEDPSGCAVSPVLFWVLHHFSRAEICYQDSDTGCIHPTCSHLHCILPPSCSAASPSPSGPFALSLKIYHGTQSHGAFSSSFHV